MIRFSAGLLCHLDDACTSNPCHADAICDTSPINGSYTCSCASGYKGVDCSEDINECEQGMTEIIKKIKTACNIINMNPPPPPPPPPSLRRNHYTTGSHTIAFLLHTLKTTPYTVEHGWGGGERRTGATSSSSSPLTSRRRPILV